MSRLYTMNVSEATGKLAELFDNLKRAIGKVPNAYATLGSNSPELLAHALQMGSVLQLHSGLSKKEIEAINLAVSEDSRCEYCLAAHTLTGRAAGFSTPQTKALRKGSYPEDSRLDALVKFALRIVDSKGTLPADSLVGVREAGFSDRQIVGTIGAISAILFTNMLNRVNDTTLDFPAAD